ncbi:MAG: anti-sigma factor family protein [Dichotomicrobium sp.]
MTEPVTEFDLLSYADGRLDHDPDRKAKIEEYLRHSPETARRVEELRAQTRALKNAYDARASEPVPQHLLDIVHEGPTRARKGIPLLRAAAMLVAAAGIGLAGWQIGQMSATGPRLAGNAPPENLFEVARAARTDQVAREQSASALAAGRLMTWRDDGVAIRLRIPDLSALGYKLAGRRTLRHASGEFVRLVYAGPDGGRLKLVLTPDMESAPQVVSVVNEGGTSLAYWSQGPLMVALAGDRGEQGIAELAEDVRSRIATAKEQPADDPANPELAVPPTKLEVTADAAQPALSNGVESVRDDGASIPAGRRIE